MHIIHRSLCVLGFCAAGLLHGAPVAADPPPPSQPTAYVARSILASAPPGIAAEDLGKPFGAGFTPLAGQGAGNLFPGAKHANKTENSFKAEWVSLDTTLKLAAHGPAWTGISVGAGGSTAERYAVFRAMQVERIEEIDDSQMGTPPAQAVYYLYRIYWGRNYERLVSGTAREFHAGVQASLVAFKAGVEGQAKNSKLKVQAGGRGLVPKTDDALMSDSVDEIQKRYSATAGPAVPVLVEYRLIPGRTVTYKGVEWMKPRPVEFRIDRIEVLTNGAMMGSAKWTVKASCRIGDADLPEVKVWDNPVKTGETYSPPDTFRGEVFENDIVRCGTKGEYKTTLGGTKAIAPGAMPDGLKVLAKPGQATGTFEARDAGTHYRVSYTLRVK